jgi:hypothetical protein
VCCCVGWFPSVIHFIATDSDSNFAGKIELYFLDYLKFIVASNNFTGTKHFWGEQTLVVTTVDRTHCELRFAKFFWVVKVDVSVIHAWNINFVQSLEACQTECVQPLQGQDPLLYTRDHQHAPGSLRLAPTEQSTAPNKYSKKKSWTEANG